MRRSLVLCLASFLGAAIAALPVSAAAATLLDERVADRQAVEEVLWRHRIWPKENPIPKPPLSAVLSTAQLRARVEDDLRKSAAMDLLLGRPITAAQLQAEMDRMARDTRDAATLREMFAAVGDDPYRIAEAIARPALADRLLRNAFALDDRFASARSSGTTFESWWGSVRQSVPVDLPAVTGSLLAPSPEAGGCVDNTWTSGTHPWVPPLFITERFESVWTGSEMLLWGTSEDYTAIGQRYSPATDTWSSIGPGGPDDRDKFSLVWTGTRMIVWGGYGGGFLNTGARYDPVTDGWSPTSTTNAPQARNRHAAVWSGTQMLVWGGYGSTGYLVTGGRYDPVADQWSAMATSGAPSGRTGQTAVWAGGRMIVWGGEASAFFTNTGGRYNPATNTWAATTTVGAPSARRYHTAVSDGSRMIVWGGYDGAFLSTGARYDPSADSWTPTHDAGAPSPRMDHVAVWTGTRMIVWSGQSNLGGRRLENDGARWDPASGWTPMTTTNVPSARYAARAVWSGTEMIVHGGWGSENTGGRYDPAADRWTKTASSGPRGGTSPTIAVWTGAEVVSWGGGDQIPGRYTPATDSWAAGTVDGAPSPRDRHAGVWTGSELVVWGGKFQAGIYGDGGRYDVTADLWRPMASSGAPTPRHYHTAVWTGASMIVWGGNTSASGSVATDTGAIYSPSTDAWAPMTGAGAPSPRYEHASVWTGKEMVVVMGRNPTSSPTTGGLYDPATDTWRPTSTVGVPTGRVRPAVGWTGAELVLWGPDSGFTGPGTGGVYDPALDTWRPTTTVGAPLRRTDLGGVWNGNELLVYGGFRIDTVNDGGRYDPSADSWTTITPGPGFQLEWMVHTGEEAIVPLTNRYCSPCANPVVGWHDGDGDGSGVPGWPYHYDCGGTLPAGWAPNGADCADADPSRHPGAVELCNGIDDDCDGTIDDVAVAAAVGGLQETRAGTVATISWTAVVSAQAYDVVSGDLATLQSTGGSFAASTIGCLANDVTATTADDAEALALGEGRWHLVRAVNCAGSGSYDDGSPTQSASRDAGIAASGVACP